MPDYFLSILYQCLVLLWIRIQTHAEWEDTNYLNVKWLKENPFPDSFSVECILRGPKNSSAGLLCRITNLCLCWQYLCFHKTVTPQPGMNQLLYIRLLQLACMEMCVPVLHLTSGCSYIEKRSMRICHQTNQKLPVGIKSGRNMGLIFYMTHIINTHTAWRRTLSRVCCYRMCTFLSIPAASNNVKHFQETLDFSTTKEMSIDFL